MRAGDIISPSQLAMPEVGEGDYWAPVNRGAAGSGVDGRHIPLSAQLRRSTRTVHAGTEAAFALDHWLSDRETYAALLNLLRAFHFAVEAALRGLDGWDELTPSINLRSRRRAFRIDQDLASLGRPASSAVPASTPVDTMPLASLAEGLGCLYVVEGSGLGGRVIAARARAALGPRLPTAFFADPARNIGREWQALRATLDSFGAGPNAAAGPAVIGAAHRTFAAFAATLTQERSHP
jgi:heme oxygenase